MKPGHPVRGVRSGPVQWRGRGTVPGSFLASFHEFSRRSGVDAVVPHAPIMCTNQVSLDYPVLSKDLLEVIFQGNSQRGLGRSSTCCGCSKGPSSLTCSWLSDESLTIQLIHLEGTVRVVAYSGNHATLTSVGAFPSLPTETPFPLAVTPLFLQHPHF